MAAVQIPPGIDPTEVPGGSPPPGVMPLAPDPEDRAYQFYVVAGVVTPVMALAVLLRIYVRATITKGLWWDDLTIVIALVVQAAYTGLVIRSGLAGLGTHAWDLTLAELLTYYKLVNPTAIVTLPAIYFTKLSLLLFYYHIFKQNRVVYFGTMFGFAYCTVFYVVLFFMYIFIKDVGASLRMTYAVAVVGVLSDVYIAILPLVAVSQLHLSSVKKWQVAAVFLIGWIAVACGFVGCVYRFNVDASDISWSLLPTFIVNTVEIDIGIICACLPVMAALFSKRQKERWWITSFRSLRSRFSASRGSGSDLDIPAGHTNGIQARPKRSNYERNAGDEPNPALPKDSVELTTMASSSGSRLDDLPHNHGGIMKTTKIEIEQSSE